MYNFKRQFDQHKPQSQGQILSALYGQVIMLAIWSFLLGLNIPLVIRDRMRGDPYGAMPWELVTIAVAFFRGGVFRILDPLADSTITGSASLCVVALYLPPWDG